MLLLRLTLVEVDHIWNCKRLVLKKLRIIALIVKRWDWGLHLLSIPILRRFWIYHPDSKWIDPFQLLVLSIWLLILHFQTRTLPRPRLQSIKNLWWVFILQDNLLLWGQSFHRFLWLLIWLSWWALSSFFSLEIICGHS